MDVTPRSRLVLRIQGLLFLVLFLAVIGLLGALTHRYSTEMDWTASGRNTLSEPSLALLARLEGPVSVTAYARQDPLLRDAITELLDRYRHQKQDLSLTFVDPDTVPDQVRRLGITVDGELVIEYGGRTEHVQELGEEQVTNALQRVARSGERWVAYLAGHGERDLLGRANHDLGEFGRVLESRGIRLSGVNLAETGAIPENARLLVVADPRVALLPGEARIVAEYLRAGGNLLWLGEPGGFNDADLLADELGVEAVPGLLVDVAAQLFGVDQPDFVVVTGYGPHEATRNFSVVTLFPQAAGLRAEPPEGWQAEPLLSTGRSAWSETGPLAGELRYEEETDTAGPLDLALALTRALDDADPGDSGETWRQQRVVVIGDADFLSNAFLGNGGNLDLGLNIANWLAGDERLIDIPARTAPDLSLQLSETAVLMVAFAALLGMPLLLSGSGLLIWLRRRRR